MLDNLIGATPAGAGKDIVKDSNSRNFMADVIEASRKVPVIVDFWAPWCGPCKQLGPALEKLVRAEKGAVRMVKINVDENQELAGQMRVQSIPAVFAFVDGQPVDGFMGALPESQLKQFIARVMGPAGGASELDAMLQAAAEATTAGDFGTAGDLYAAILQEDRENTAAIAGMAMIRLLLGDPDGAEATLALCPPAKLNDPLIIQAKAAIDLASQPAADLREITSLTAKVDSEPGNNEARFDLALALNQVGRQEEALDHLIYMVRHERGWNDEAARKQLLQFFAAWGPKDPMTLLGRRKLSAVLFS
jgi:putative thioredoxin